MTYNQLLYFVTTVKYNSITKASNKLFVTQPAISLAIKSLEQEFNTILFERNNNQLIITDSGKYLYQEAVKLIDSFDSLKDNVTKYISDNIKIKIGIPPMIGTFLFPKIFNKYSDYNKNIKLITTEFGSFGLIEALNNNEIDLAITSTKDVNENINSYLIQQTELLYTVNKKHHLANRKYVAISDIKDEPIVLLKEDSYQNMIINNLFKKENITPNVILNSNQLYTIKQLLSYNTASAFMFKEIVQNDPDLVGIPLKEPIKIDIQLLWNKKMDDNILVQDFINFIKQLNLNKNVF